jgi:hypothetical protein
MCSGDDRQSAFLEPLLPIELRRLPVARYRLDAWKVMQKEDSKDLTAWRDRLRAWNQTVLAPRRQK